MAENEDLYPAKHICSISLKQETDSFASQGHISLTFQPDPQNMGNGICATAIHMIYERNGGLQV